MNTKVLTAHLPVDLATRLDVTAQRLDRSRAWIVKQAVGDWLDQEEERHRLTLEGLADADAGRTIEHATVRSWAEALQADDRLPAGR